jgi:hypothetical protein
MDAKPLTRPGGGEISGLPTSFPTTDVPYALNFSVRPGEGLQITIALGETNKLVGHCAVRVLAQAPPAGEDWGDVRTAIPSAQSRHQGVDLPVRCLVPAPESAPDRG